MANDAQATRFFEKGEQITASITVQRSAAKVFEAWSGFDSVADVVPGVHSVAPVPDGTYRFVLDADPEASSPDLRIEILVSQPGHRLAWRSVGDSPLPIAGSLTLKELPFARGTELKAVIDYIPDKWALGRRIDKARGKDPEQLLRLALFRFRQLAEAHEIATTRGQPAGRGEGRDAQGSSDEHRFTTEDQP